MIIINNRIAGVSGGVQRDSHRDIAVCVHLHRAAPRASGTHEVQGDEASHLLFSRPRPSE